MKKLTAILLAIIMLLPLIACSAEQKSSRPEQYDVKLLKVGDKDVTYEYFRYLYSYIKTQYEESKTESTLEEMKEQILSKLKRDVAVSNLLKDYSQSLTEEEIRNLDDYIASLKQTYGDKLETILETEMSMTLDVFTAMNKSDYEYSKLYTYVSTEKNGAVDFSDKAIEKYLDKFMCGMHIVFLKNEHDKKDAETLMKDIYTVALLDEAFTPFRKLHELGESMNTINDSINKITDQIAEGKDVQTLSATLASLTEKLSEVSAEINKSLSDLDLDAALDNYLEKLGDYKAYVKDIVNNSITSEDAAVVKALDGEISEIGGKITESIKTKIAETLVKASDDLISDKSKYGWLTEEFKNAIASFKEAPTSENANAINEMIVSSTDMKKDESLFELAECFGGYSAIASGKDNYYTQYSAICELNGTYKGLSLTKEANFMLYAAVREAEEKAYSLKGIKENVFTSLEESYDSLSGIVVPFDQLCVQYSDDYSEETPVAYFFKPESLLPELKEAIKDMNEGEMTAIVESTVGYHILKLVEKDEEYFKENEYPYYVLEDMIESESEKIAISDDEAFKSLDEEVIVGYEKEIAKANGTLAEPTETPEDTSNYLVITIIVIAATVAVVAVLVVLIISAGKGDGKSKKAPTKKTK